MDTVTRRRFLSRSRLALGAAALAAAGGDATWAVLTHRARTEARPSGQPVVVVVTLYGGNDGLGTVVPYADPAYRKARGDLAYADHEVLPLGDGLALNPALENLHARWGNRQLAVVRGVGYPRPDRSHFRSMDIWQTASPITASDTGWVGRWLDATGGDPLQALVVGNVLPPLAIGARTIAAAVPPRPTGAVPAPLQDSLRALAQTDPTDTGVQPDVVRSFATTLDTQNRFPAATPASTAVTSDLAAQLATVAHFIRIGAPSRIYAVDLDGFDTHADERSTQEALLGQLDDALGGFLDALAGSARARDVVVVVYSEFGRRVAANASDGTDHGTAGPVLLLGDRVRAGFHGAQPSLTDLDDGDLKADVDFRSVYAELLRHLGTDPGRVVPGGPAPISLLD